MVELAYIPTISVGGFVPLSLHPHQHLLLLVSSVLAIQTGVR